MEVKYFPFVTLFAFIIHCLCHFQHNFCDISSSNAMADKVLQTNQTTYVIRNQTVYPLSLRTIDLLPIEGRMWTQISEAFPIGQLLKGMLHNELSLFWLKTCLLCLQTPVYIILILVFGRMKSICFSSSVAFNMSLLKKSLMVCLLLILNVCLRCGSFQFREILVAHSKTRKDVHSLVQSWPLCSTH